MRVIVDELESLVSDIPIIFVVSEHVAKANFLE